MLVRCLAAGVQARAVDCGPGSWDPVGGPGADGAGRDMVGSRYEGEWVRGRREGRGRMERDDGTCYDGEWLVRGTPGSGRLQEW